MAIPTYELTVDYDRALAEMIAVGRYDEVDYRITAEHFPIEETSGTVETEASIVHLDRSATTGEVESEIARRGLRPARIEELLAFGEAYPEINEKFSVFALGSSWEQADGNRHVVHHWTWQYRSHLSLQWTGEEWNKDFRFLAVPPREGEPRIVSSESMPRAFPLTLARRPKLSKMIEAGAYDEVDENITARNFPIEHKRAFETEAVLVYLNRSADIETVESEIARRGLRPARIEELLAFGEAYPEIQREFHVVELGSSWQNPSGNLQIAYLTGRERPTPVRGIHLRWTGHNGDDEDRYLGVRE